MYMVNGDTCMEFSVIPFVFLKWVVDKKPFSQNQEPISQISRIIPVAKKHVYCANKQNTLSWTDAEC